MQATIPENWTREQFEWLQLLGRATSQTARSRLLNERREWCRPEVVQTLLASLSPRTPLEASAWLDAGAGLVVVADSLQNASLQGQTRAQLAYLAFFVDEFERALTLCEEAIRHFRRANDRLGLARAWHLQAEILLYTQGAERALPLYERARTVYVELNANEFLARCDYSLIRVYHLLGQHERALRTARNSYQLAVRQANRPMQARLRTAEGIVLRAMARYDEAIDAYQDALSIWRSEQNPLEQARIIANIGLVYWSMGLLAEARSHYAEAMPLFSASGSRLDVAICQTNTALILLEEGDPLQARALVREALAYYQAIGDLEGIALCALLQAEALESLGRYREAFDSAHQACVEYRKVGNLSQLAYGRIVKARNLIPLGRYDEARQTLQQARSLLSQTRQDSLLATSHFYLGEVARITRQPEQAERHYQTVLEHLNSLTGLAGVPPEEMSRLLGQFRPMVSQIGWFFTGRGDYRRAYQVLQQTKGVALRLSLNSQQVGNRFLSQQQVRRLTQLQQAWEQAQQNAQRSPQKRQEATRRYNEWQRYRRQLAQRSPQWASAQNLPLSPNELPLDARTAVVEYAFASDGIAIVVVRKQGNRTEARGATVRVPREQVLTTIKDLQRALETGRQLSTIASFAQRLYGWLLRPIENLLQDAQKVVFCPDGELHGVPWAVLQGRDNRYLIERYEIATASSASVWGYAERASRASPSAFERPLMVALSEFPSNGGSGVRARLSPLPGVRREQTVFVRLLGRSAQVLQERNATRERVIENAKRATLLHIATHAVPNLRLPLLSALALYGTREPTWLYANDILQARLSARLVVLSACSTAEGAVGNDGMMGLSWAFMLAGCPSVLTTLWKLPDESVPMWMEAFYTALRQRRSVAQSVREATLRLLRDSRYRHPRYWGAWIVQGAG